jgi:hypothetical protein
MVKIWIKKYQLICSYIFTLYFAVMQSSSSQLAGYTCKMESTILIENHYPLIPIMHWYYFAEIIMLSSAKLYHKNYYNMMRFKVAWSFAETDNFKYD